MGQAKQRGTFQERIQQSRIRQEAEEVKHRQVQALKQQKPAQQERERQQRLIDQHGHDKAMQILDREKKKRNESRALIAAVFGMIAGSFFPRR